MANLSSWKRLNLDEVFWFQEGPGVRKWQFTDSGIKLLNVANIEKSRTINLEKTDRHLDSKEVEERYSHFLLDAGDLVIASSGISFDDDGMLRTRGAFVEEVHLPLCLNTSTIRFKSKPEISDLGYLQHWLDSREFREQITKRVTGSAQQNFGPSHLKEIKITLPPFPEQRRIAAILDQADALRTKRREALAQLDSLTQSIFVEMFGNQAANPKNWNIVPLGEVIDDLTDYHANGSYEILRNHVELLDSPDYALMLRTTDLENNDFSMGVKYITEAAYNFLKKSQVFGGEIVINKIGSAGSVYLAPYLNRPVSLGMNSFLLRIAKSANSRFVYDVLKSDYITGVIRSKVRGAVTKTITKEAVRSIDIPLPPLEIQNKYVNRVDAITEQKRLQSKSLSEFDALFASIQHRAFRGEL